MNPASHTSKASIAFIAGLFLATPAMGDVARTCYGTKQSAPQVDSQNAGRVPVNQRATPAIARYKCRTSYTPRTTKRRRLVRIPVMLGVYR